MDDLEDIKITGLMVNYYHICTRKLWLFSRRVGFESKSDRVLLGKLLHKRVYKETPAKELLFDNLIRIDLIKDGNISEIKLSDKMSYATVMQLSYYLLYLKRYGIEKMGTINYPLQKKKVYITLTEDLEKELMHTLEKVQQILSQNKPPPVEKKEYCRQCAYFEFCFIE